MNSQPSASPPSRGATILASWWIIVLLVLGVVAVYWPVFGYGFVEYDDQKYVVENTHIQVGLSWPGVIWAFTTFYAGNWHPLTWLSYMLDTQLFGFHPQGYHAVNVLFHAANTVLLFLLLKRLTGALWRSAFVAALFAFHPLHVESVAWVAERKDVLSTFFFMLTLMAYTRYAQKRSKVEGRKSSAKECAPGEMRKQPAAGSTLDSGLWTLDYSLALFFFTLGLLSKPMLVTLPFVLLLLDYWPLGRVTGDRWRVTRLILEKIPFFVLSAVSCVVTFLAQQHGDAVVSTNVIPLGERLQNAIVAYWIYVEKMLWPAPLAPFYPYSLVRPDATVVAAFLLLLISVAAFLSPRQRPYLVVGWLWYLGTLVPVIGLVQVGAQALADRYTYVPLIGIFIAVTWGAGDLLSGWRHRRAVVMAASLVVLGVCLTLTAAQVRYWRDSETLARHALAVTADNSTMELVLGDALSLQKKPKEAAEHFADAARISPDNAKIQSNLGLALASEGKVDEAIAAYHVALKLKPREVRPHYMLASVLSQQGNIKQAIAEYQTTLQIDPDYALALNDFSWLLATGPDARLRNGTEAVTLAERACRLTNYKMTLFVGTLAASYAEAGRFDDAVKTANQAIALATAGGQESLAAKNRELLKLYQARKAYHQPAVH